MSDVRTLEISDPQGDFLESRKKHTGFVAGFGSGKSFIGTLKTLLKVINDRIPKVAYYLPTYGDIRDIAFDGFPTVCSLLGYDYKLNKTDKEFKILHNGQELGVVMFRNMSEPESIVGYQVGYSLIDETDILKKEIMDKAFKKILGRNRLVVQIEDDEVLSEYDETGEPPEGTYWHNELSALCWINSIDVAGTPEGFKWFYDRFERNFNIEFDLLVRASTYSNLHNLPADFIDTLRSQYPAELFNAYVEGLFVNITSGTVYKYFNRHTHDSQEEVISYQGYHEPIFVGADFNVGGCVNSISVQRGNSFHLVDEMVSYDTKEMGDNLFGKYYKHPIYFYPDASLTKETTNASRSDLEIIKEKASEYGADIEIIKDASNPRIMDRVNAVNNAFEKKWWYVNTKRCPRHTEAFEQQAWDEKTGKPEKFNEHPSIDDFCFSGDTMVIVNGHQYRIDNIPKNGYIKGHSGKYVFYRDARPIGLDTILDIKLKDGNIIKATPDHLFLTLDGWVQAKNLKGKVLCESQLYQMIVKSLEGSSFTEVAMTTFIKLWGHLKRGKEKNQENQYTVLFGSILMEKFLKAWLYIIKTKTNLTMILKILKLWISQNIDQCTLENGQKRIEAKCSKTSERLSTKHRNGTDQKKALNGISNIMKTLKMLFIKKKNSFAKNAERNTSQQKAGECFALKLARQRREEIAELIMRQDVVKIAEKSSLLANMLRRKTVQSVAGGNKEKQKVYCLTVPSDGCFSLASGEIVSNCDNFGYKCIKIFPVHRPKATARTLDELPQIKR